MFDPTRVAQALEANRERFHRSVEANEEMLRTYLEAFDQLSAMSSAELEQAVSREPWPGARPTAELDLRGPIVPFTFRWQTAQEARSWALERLRGVPTVAVDGSQIVASREFGVPISLVQVGWFENFHDATRPYVKDIRDEIVVADDDGSGDGGEYARAESRVNRRRFSLEIETAISCMDHLDRDHKPVLFFDGTLVLSFLARIDEHTRRGYLADLFPLLEATESRRIPIVGYVDYSSARDLVALLRHVFDLPPGPLVDAQLIARRTDYFDRTAAFACARGDILVEYRTAERDFSGDVCFVYLAIGPGRPPARLDIPRWVVEDGLLDHVVDIVRAEVVVGAGYPYALETADAAAVLTVEDRLAFYRLFHNFAEKAGLSSSLPRKTASKVRRR